MLDERKLKAVEMKIEGKGNVEIAKFVGVSRTSVWIWFQEDEVRAEVDRLEQEIKTHAMNRFNSKTDDMIANAYNLAMNSPSDKVKADMTTYWIDRVLGKTTSKLELLDKTDENVIAIDILSEELSELDTE